MTLRTIRDLALTIAAITLTAHTVETSYTTGALGDLVWALARKG